MYLYLISQDNNNNYDTYDSAVVAAENEEQARETHPGGTNSLSRGTWAEPQHVQVTLIGVAIDPGVTEPGVVCASFNAG